jgi:putative glutamine amidotransferase
MIIGVTDILRGHDALDNYLRWVRIGAPEVETRILSAAAPNGEDLQVCDGLLLTGGGDVHPKFYGREDALGIVKEVKVERDEFEFRLIHEALLARKPILGICRGCQVFNVALGGTLIPDLPGAGFLTHAKGEAGSNTHGVHIVPGTGLRSLLGADGGAVNTSHHQSIDKPGKDLRVTATSDDGVVEGLEWKDAAQKPWIQMVQWHPERAWGLEHSFSRRILEGFVSAIGATRERGYVVERSTKRH